MNDWLSRDDEVVKKYNKNPKCKFSFSNRAFYDMFTGMLSLNDINNINSLDKYVPYLLVSGDEDPVGDFGEGVKKVYNQYVDLGINSVDIKLFKGYRHEILNELDKYEVYNYIYKWILSKMND